MASQITNYKCPACTGPLHFVGASGKLECDYCGSNFDVAEIEALYADKEAQAVEAAQEAVQKSDNTTSGEGWDYSSLSQWGADGAGMKAYSCPSCGAELICDETTSATSCPYCGNPTVIPGQFSGGLRPDYVLPFKLDQAAAKRALKNFYGKKKFLPRVFTSQNKIKEIKGVYVPFWLFDGVADADVTFSATTSSSFREGDYEITETQYYDVQRSAVIPFEKIPVDASKKMPNEYMDAIEPFDYSELKPFSTAYLPGFLADKYDETAESCARRADDRAKNTTIEILRSDVTGYASVRPRSSHIQLERGKVSYGLLPVYLLNTRWNGKDYLFAMNGQTGKLVGNLPLDNKKYWCWFAGIAAAITAVFGTGFFLLMF